jgi:hypothetical protein
MEEILKNLEKLKPYIDYLISEKIPESQGKDLIKSCTKLDQLTKNFIYLYCYPRPLLDRELPQRINDTSNFNKRVLLLCEACRTDQYSRYIKHLSHAFLDEDKVVFRIIEDLSDEDFCPICGKKLENNTTYGSKDSSSMLCDNCLKALVITRNIMEIIDPGFLDWRKKYNLNLNKKGEIDWSILRNQ